MIEHPALDATKRVEELLAQCAAMREALETVQVHEDEQTGSICADCSADILRALASDAGKALLERLEKAERERDEAKTVRWRLPQQDLEDSANRARAETIERCAKVAEMHADDWRKTGTQYGEGAEHACIGVAAAIGALAKESS